MQRIVRRRKLWRPSAAVVCAGVVLCVLLMGESLGANTVAGQAPAASHPAVASAVPGVPPTTPEAVKQKVQQLRAQYAPYLRSLPEPLAVRRRTTVEGPWRAKFEIEKAASGDRPEPPGWFREDYDDSGWEADTVPEWRYAAESYRQPVSCILWYRTRFIATPPKSGRRTFLVFHGVDWEAEVWLNGKLLGRHKTYYEPFRFDVTGML
jgi:hypothetical protein